MAKAKVEKEKITTENITALESNVEVAEPKAEPKVVKETVETKTGPTYDELMSIVQQLAGEVAALKANNTQTTSQPQSNNGSDKTDKILELLANRKSDKEVVIVHNCELMGGLSTHIDLTGLVIDFHTIGEQRLLSWQQFEECVSKYRSFFEKEIILLSDNDYELAERYHIPCVKRGNNNVLTHADIEKLPTMTTHELEDYIKSLTQSDKEFVFSYWLGKCYDKSEGFYDRYKIELLNSLSGNHAFDNLLTLMNGDFRNE